MTPGLLLPLALTALLALAIPVVIHISRRTETRIIDSVTMASTARTIEFI